MTCIVVVNGAGRVGKSTLARAVPTQFGRVHVRIDDDRTLNMAARVVCEGFGL